MAGADEWPRGVGTIPVIIDGGDYLTQLVPPAVKSLGWQYEALLTSSAKKTAEFFQGSAKDTNGPMFYPDWQVRADVLYINGGKAGSHGRSMGEAGRENVEAFFAAGGSVVGSCAGALIMSTMYSSYIGIWDGEMGCCGGNGTQTAVFDSADPIGAYLLEHAGTTTVSGIRHQGGPRFDEGLDHPEETEFLGMITRSTTWGKGTPDLIVYQTAGSGRMVIQPNHPEKAKAGTQLALMEAVLLHARAGSRTEPAIKGDLTAGQPVADVVGEGQYQRYRMDVPAGLAELTIATDAPAGTEVYLTFEGVAYSGGSDYSGDVVTIVAPPAGRWEASVLGTHTTANGVPYRVSVAVVWDSPQLTELLRLVVDFARANGIPDRQLVDWLEIVLAKLRFAPSAEAEGEAEPESDRVVSAPTHQQEAVFGDLGVEDWELNAEQALHRAIGI